MENQKLTTEIIDELKAEHGEISQIDGIEHDIVIVAPSRAQFKRFTELSNDVKKRDRAKDGIIADCVVWPDKEALSALFDVRPGYRETISNVLMEAAGIVGDATAKKL
jgi:hypothetical protein